MAKVKRKVGAPGAAAPGGDPTAEAFALWGRGNVLQARRVARALLDRPAGEGQALSEGQRSDLQRLLADTAPDPRAFQIGLFAVTVVAVVILLTRLFD